MTQDEIKKNFSKNLIELRKDRNMTQLALAEALNYSDKAVSKWEVGMVLPDVETMSNIAEFFGVTVNDLIYTKSPKVLRRLFTNKVFITLIAIVGVWFLTSIAYLILSQVTTLDRVWISFIIAIPISAVVLMVFSFIWFNKVWQYISVSLLLWSILLTIYLGLFNINLWFIFIVGIIGQILITFSFSIKSFGHKREK